MSSVTLVDMTQSIDTPAAQLTGASFSADHLSSAFLSKALETAGYLANDAAEVISATAGRGAGPGWGSTPYDWITDTDRTLERHTRRVLAKEFPGMPVIGEELSNTGSALPDLYWTVDPVDGAANYVAGLPWCSYSLALVDRHGPAVGVIADPYRGQIYAAARGRGMRANGAPVLLPLAGMPLAGGLICTELPGATPWPELPVLLDRCQSEHVGLRILGSSALAITQVALGRASAAVLRGYQVWDVAAAVALAASSGMEIRGWDGLAHPLPTDGMVVAAPHLIDTISAWFC